MSSAGVGLTHNLDELHGQLSSFAGTTGVIGCLLVSLVGAALTADPPSKKPSKDAELETQRAKHRAATLAAGKERHQWLQELVGREWDMYDRDDYYYLLLVGSFGMSMQTVVMSTIVLTNLQAIPQSLAKKFVAKHHIWVAMPAIMIGPACLSLCAALCTAQTPDPPSAQSPCGSSSSELRGEPPAHISLERDGDPPQPHSRAR